MVKSCWVLFRMKIISNKIVEKTQTYIICSLTVSPPHTLCYLSDNVEKCCRAGQATEDNIIWHMHCACWITKATDTDWEYVMLIAFPWQQWSCERVSLLCFYIIASLVHNNIRSQIWHLPMFNKNMQLNLQCFNLVFGDAWFKSDLGHRYANGVFHTTFKTHPATPY